MGGTKLHMTTPSTPVAMDTLENRIKDELIALGLFDVQEVTTCIYMYMC